MKITRNKTIHTWQQSARIAWLAISNFFWQSRVKKSIFKLLASSHDFIKFLHENVWGKQSEREEIMKALLALSHVPSLREPTFSLRVCTFSSSTFSLLFFCLASDSLLSSTLLLSQAERDLETLLLRQKGRTQTMWISGFYKNANYSYHLPPLSLLIFKTIYSLSLAAWYFYSRCWSVLVCATLE
jgi:hypothetical protein